jgi:four helix bundle protein
MTRHRNWTELVVWQASHEFVLSLYGFLKSLPVEERSALTDQLRRAAYSIPANIVEGHAKSSLKDFNKYLYISRGSVEEVKYFILLSKDLGYLSEETYTQFTTRLSKISSMLNNLIESNKKAMA